MATSAAILYPPIDFNLDFPAPDDDDDKSPAQKIHDSDTSPEEVSVSEAEAPLMHSVELDHDSVTFINSTKLERKEFWRFGPPIYGDTGDLIPVSVGPMSESDYAEWKSGSLSDGGYFPDGEIAWDLAGEKEMTLWDVFLDMAVAARGQVASVASGDLRSCGMAWLLELLEEDWQHKGGKDGGEEVNEHERLMNIERILNAVPPRWMPDSSATSCMLCSARFHPIMFPRHHCRFCGAIFCGECSKGRSLLPPSYMTSDPQRVCDSCSAKLEGVQNYLMNEVSRAAQPPTHDLTDLSTLRSWLNFPWGQSMEYEIYKAANTIHGYTKAGMMRSERSIPESILKQAKGLAILTVANVGVMVTYKIGTGLVIARREDGSWSPPSAISTFGLGWGAQAGGELTDFIIVLRNTDAIRTFSGEAHLSVGAGLSAAVGIVGRSVEADFRAGDGGYAACYTYSCSKGAFVGCSLNGSMVTTRNSENGRFYGDPSIKASDILLGSWPKPPAAAILYNALADLYRRL